MPVTAEDLCAFLLDLDAPDRLERPLLLSREASRVGVTLLAAALEEFSGRRCDVELLPGEHLGTITVPVPASVLTLVVGSACAADSAITAVSCRGYGEEGKTKPSSRMYW